MAIVNNPWIGYITRSYQQIKASLIQGLVTKNPEITDHSESNILIILISMFSGIAEMLGYYIDNAAREAFAISARRYQSMVKHTKWIDYRIKAANPSTTDVVLTFSSAVPLNMGTGAPYQLPTGISAQNSTSTQFFSQNTSPISITAGSTTITLPFIQEVTFLNQNLGTSDGSTQNQKFALPDGYVDGSMTLVIGGVPYSLRDTMAYSFPSSTDYIVDIDETGTAYIILGDGVNGLIPIPGAALIGSYKTTSGDLGNLAAQTITILNTDLSPYLPGGTTVTVSNINPSTGGAGYEGIEDIRKRAPLSIRTLYRAVTEQDYVDITLLHPGVSKADTNYDCGKYVDIFIVPINGGIAETGLLTSVGNYLDDKKMVGTFPIIRPAGVTNMVISMDIYLRFRVDPAVATPVILSAIKNFFSLQNQNINSAIHYSVLEALVQDISYVEYLNITKLTTHPYARPGINNSSLTGITQPELNWVTTVKPACVTESEWTVLYQLNVVYPAGKFIITRNGLYDGEVLPNTLYNSPSGDISMTFITFSLADYITNQSWDFKTYPHNQDVQLDDFTIPAVNLDSDGVMLDISLNIIQQLTPSN